MTASNIYNLYRALYTFKNPLTSFHGEPVKLIEINYDQNQQENKNLKIGEIKYCKIQNVLLVQCKDYKSVGILKLSIGKKKIMTARDFNNGFLKKCIESEKLFK